MNRTAADSVTGTEIAYVRILGSVQIVMADGRTRDLASPTQRRLAALLALNARRPTRAERLADELHISPGALRTTISRLRRALGDGVLCTDATGYRLETDVDSELFCQFLPPVEHDADRLQRLTSALALWKGKALEEFSDESWARGDAIRLTELHAATVEDLASELIARARWPEAIAALEQHIAAHPVRDHPRGLLMQALAGSGRQADALAAYRAYRTYLAAELGAEPSTQVREIGRRIAQPFTDRAQEQPPRAAAIAMKGASSDLPRYRSTLIGRREDLAAIVEQVRTARLLTLTGVGGAGKTRLAVALAHELSAAGTPTWFVELAALREPADIVSSIASAVGAAPTDSAPTLTALLADRRGLLVLDNCEHVLDAVVPVIDALSLRCPGMVVVTTSREFLALEGEHVYHVRPLDPATAGADLLAKLALAAGARLDPTDRPVLEEICRRLDGIPLAIEIAATRAGGLGIRALLSSLEDSFTLLGAGRRRSVDRQQTLGNAIDWSYQLLNPEEQQLFRSLGIFSGGFEVDAATDVMTRLGAPAKAVPLLVSALVTRSMVEADLRPTVTRYRILEPLRAFALETLTAKGELAAAEAAHARWIASLTDVSMDRFYSRECHAAAVRLEREADNWRAAFTYAWARQDAPLARELCGAPTTVLLLGRPDLSAPVVRIDSLLQLRDSRRAAVATAHMSLGINTLSAADIERGLSVYEQCDPTGRTGGRRLLQSGWIMMTTGDCPTALTMLGESISDPDVPSLTVDYTAAIAVYIACSTRHRGFVQENWLLRVRAAAEESPVPATRLLARRALAWAAADSDPEQSIEWTRRALEVQDALPLIERRLAGASLSQLLEGESPSLAARRLRELMVEQADRGYTDDQTLLVTSVTLLARCDHPCADDAIATVARTAAAGHLSVSVGGVAERIGRGTPLTREALRMRILEGLSDLAAQEALDLRVCAPG